MSLYIYGRALPHIAPPFSPASVFKNGATGLWLAGGDPAKVYGPDKIPGAYLDSAGADPLTAVGESAGLVLDLSEDAAVSGGTILGDHATQSTQAAEPTLRYDSTLARYYWEPDGADFWEADGSVGTLTGDFEIHAAVRRSGNTNGTIVGKFDTGHSASNHPRGWFLTCGTGTDIKFQYRTTGGIGPTTITGQHSGSDLVVGVRREGSTITVSADGVDLATGTQAASLAADFTASLQIFRAYWGAAGFVDYYSGRVYGDGLVLINNKSLTTDERTSLIKYLAKQQGRTL